MYFEKPVDLTYTQIAMAVDGMVYSDSCDDEKLFEYIYHLCSMLAFKNKYFTKYSYYEDFAIYAATETFLRYKNPKQFDSKYKMGKIKSVLNYLKNTLYFRKVEFEQLDYSQTLQTQTDDIGNAPTSPYQFSHMLSDAANHFVNVEVDCYFNDVIKTIRSFLSRLPRKQHSMEWHDIYISCLLTLLSSLMLPNDVIKNKNGLNESIFYKHAANFTVHDVILYHLDSSYADYIYVLVKRIKRIISEDISDLCKTAIDTASISPLIAMQEINSVFTNEDA